MKELNAIQATHERFESFEDLLDEEMVKDSQYWVKYYKGREEQIKTARRYSLSDRSRYYLGNKNLADCFNKYFNALGILIYH